MDTLATFLANIVWPLASRVLAAMGIGYLTYTGVDAAAASALTAAKSAVGSIPADIALLIARFGFFEYMAITSGGLLSGLAWMYAKKLVVSTVPT